MPRRAKNPTELMKWRLDQSIATTALAEKTGLTQASVYRIERGDSISRALANKYLSYWGGDLRNLKGILEHLDIIDEGWAVRISFKNQN